MTEEAATIPTFTHSVKLSDTAKGIRIDVHVYANDRTTAVQEALDTYIEAKTKAEWAKIPVAPVEVVAK